MALDEIDGPNSNNNNNKGKERKRMEKNSNEQLVNTRNHKETPTTKQTQHTTRIDGHCYRLALQRKHHAERVPQPYRIDLRAGAGRAAAAAGRRRGALRER